MWKRILLIVYIVVLLFVGMPQLALADSIDITVVARPYIGGGITDFVITYVSETQLDISWSFTGDAVNIMIRGKYGDYPEDRDDGYLVYYGSDVTTSDTNMDFDENPGPLYYRAWGQKVDEVWYEDYQDGYEESAILTLIAFIIFAGIMSYIGSRSTYWILKFLAGGAWFAFAIYWINNPPSTIVQGSATDTVVIVLLFVIGLAFMFMPFWYPQRENGQEIGGRLRLPFMKTDEQEALDNQQRYSPTMRERNENHRDRVNNALRGNIRRRR